VNQLAPSNLSGRTAVVTGGTDGIGRAIARGLAARNAQVIIVGSNPEKGAVAERDIRILTDNDQVHFLQADLSLMRETDRVADVINSRFRALDRLVLCAGIVRARRIETAEGVESNFAVNYLTRFLLTGRLLARLQAAGASGSASRIVVISGAARSGKIHYEDINLTRNFGIVSMVSQFCEANDLFVTEQARRMREAGGQSSVTITALKVGVVRTNIRREFPRWMKLIVPLLFDPFLAQTPEQIAESALRLLAAQEFEGVTGALYSHIRHFRPVKPYAHAQETDEGRRLWLFSEQLVARTRAVAA
jgi:NAD(P)-dependent dehydrogenase (short-subunit alcohol dehydrogenase family)